MIERRHIIARSIILTIRYDWRCHLFVRFGGSDIFGKMLWKIVSDSAASLVKSGPRPWDSLFSEGLRV
jgi:hypothetical protein